MAPRPTVSAVVATYNRRHALPRFVDACLAARGLDELVVAVDGSADGSFEYLRERERYDDRVTPVWVDHQGQFGALDAGARTARGEVLLLLDDDVEVAPDTPAGHAAHHATRRDLVVLGYMPTVLDASTAPEFATVLYDREYESRCAHYEADPSSVLTNLWGGHLSLRRSDYLALGYEPLAPPPGGEGIRLYHQDTEFGLRCRDRGLRGLFDRTLVARHHHQRSLDGFLSDSFGRGAVTVLISRAHPDAPTPVGAGTDVDRVDGILRHLVRRPTLASLLGAMTTGVARVMVRTGSLKGATFAGKAARRVELARGAAVMEQLLDSNEPHVR